MDIKNLAASIDDDRAAELKWVLPGSALRVSAEDALGAAPQHPRPDDVGPPTPLHAERPVALLGVVDDQGEGDALALPEVSGGRGPSHPDGDQLRALRSDVVVPVAQLRDPLTTKRSPVVPEPHNDGRPLGPQIAEPDFIPERIRQAQTFDTAQVRHRLRF
jgi:hypothetical protein